MSSSSAPYVDFQQFFVTRQNLDLVAMTGWRECVARVLNSKAVVAKAEVTTALSRAPQNARDRFPSQAVRRKTP